MTIARRVVWPGLLLAAVALAMAVAFQLGTAQEKGGLSDRGSIRGTVEYSLWGADGVLKAYSSNHNATLTGLLNDARARLGIDGTTIGNSDLYNNIQAVGSDLSGATPSNAQLSSNLSSANPVSGTAATATESGNYTVTNTFTASGASTIEELQLSKGAGTNGTAETPGAWQNVSIVLASGDTLAVTWTIDID